MEETESNPEEVTQSCSNSKTKVLDNIILNIQIITNDFF